MLRNLFSKRAKRLKLSFWEISSSQGRCRHKVAWQQFALISFTETAGQWEMLPLSWMSVPVPWFALTKWTAFLQYPDCPEIRFKSKLCPFNNHSWKCSHVADSAGQTWRTTTLHWERPACSLSPALTMSGHHASNMCSHPYAERKTEGSPLGLAKALKKCLHTLQLAAREVGSQSHAVFSNRNGALLVSAGALLAALRLGSGICACSFQHGYHVAKLKGAFPVHCHSWASPAQAAQDVCAGEQRCSCCISVMFAWMSKGWHKTPACGMWQGVRSCTFQNRAKKAWERRASWQGVSPRRCS